MSDQLNISKTRTYAVIGSGAVGGYYGWALARAGFETHFLFRTHYQYVREHGLTIHSQNGVDTVLVQAYEKVSDMPKCDVIIIALKTTQNDALKTLLPPLLKENSVIMVMENGLGNEDEIALIAPTHRILSAPTTISAAVIAPGNIKVSYPGSIKLSEYNCIGEITDTMRTVAENFKEANIPVELHPNYLYVRWFKLLWNIPFSGLSIVHKTTADQLANHEIPLLRELVWEIIAIAKAYDVTLTMDDFNKLLESTQKVSNFRPSMLLDYNEGKPLELKSFYANPIAAAKARNVPCPALEALYANLLNMDTKRKSNLS